MEFDGTFRSVSSFPIKNNLPHINETNAMVPACSAHLAHTGLPTLAGTFGTTEGA